MEKLIDEILEIFIENVSCHHIIEYNEGRPYDDVEYDIDENRVKEKIKGLFKIWLPTSENINTLPDPIRKYIHDLEANCDPAGMVQENAILKDMIKTLEIKIGSKYFKNDSEERKK